MSAPLVCKDHHSVVSLGANDSSNALSSLPNGIKREEIVLFNLERLSEVREPSLENETLRVLIRYSDHHHRSASRDSVTANALVRSP